MEGEADAQARGVERLQRFEADCRRDQAAGAVVDQLQSGLGAQAVSLAAATGLSSATSMKPVTRRASGVFSTQASSIRADSGWTLRVRPRSRPPKPCEANSLALPHIMVVLSRQSKRPPGLVMRIARRLAWPGRMAAVRSQRIGSSDMIE
jgi:hypothetical protein